MGAEPDVLDMTDSLIDQLGDMHVIQRVHDPPALTLTDDQADIPQQPQLMRDSGLLHPDRVDELRDRMRALAQLREDQHPARRRQPLHRVRDPHSDLHRHLAREARPSTPWLTARTHC